MNVQIVLDDPAGNSYIQVCVLVRMCSFNRLSMQLLSFQNVYAPEPDPEMTVIHYQRTFEQNELLGLTEMKTEDYV